MLDTNVHCLRRNINVTHVLHCEAQQTVRGAAKPNCAQCVAPCRSPRSGLLSLVLERRVCRGSAVCSQPRMVRRPAERKPIRPRPTSKPKKAPTKSKARTVPSKPRRPAQKPSGTRPHGPAPHPKPAAQEPKPHPKPNNETAPSIAQFPPTGSNFRACLIAPVY